MFLQGGLPSSLSLWWGFLRYSFAFEKFSLSSGVLFYNFPLLYLFGDPIQYFKVLVIFLLSKTPNAFFISISYHWFSFFHFSVPNSIPISLLYILMVCVRDSSYYYYYYYYYYYLLLESFSHWCHLIVFDWKLRDSKSPQVTGNLLSILADLNNVVVWMCFNWSSYLKSSSPFNNYSMTVQRAPITFGINVTFMFHSYFSVPEQGQGTYPSFHFLSILLCPVSWGCSTWQGPIYGLNRTNSILMLNWILWVNWIAWNRNVFDN